MSRESAVSKVAVVVGIGAIAFGIAALRSRPEAKPPASPDRVQGVSTSTAYIPPNGDITEPAKKPQGPTQFDRIKLVEAANDGDLATVEALHAKGVGINGVLGNAAGSGNVKLVSWLIAHGVEAREDEDASAPPILQADEHDAVVAFLLAKGAHETTLAKAVTVAAPKAVARLLAHGASASSKTAEGEPVLMVAVRDAAGPKRRVIVDALLKGGADVNAKYDDETPLSLALTSALAAGDDLENPGDRASDIVYRLVARGAKVDGDALIAAMGTSPAMGANDDRRGTLLDVLLGGTLARDATARAAAFAADNHDPASIKRLATKGIAWASLGAETQPPLANAIVASDVPMVRALLEAGAPLDRMGEDGDTGLLTAVAAAAGESDDAVRVVRVLLDRGASANKRGRDGRTALFAAAQQGSETLVALLVSRGARVDDMVDGRTPLEAADSAGHETVVKLLRARGAKRRHVSDEG